MISVIVAVYNPGEFLRPCIESIIGQSFSDWELILVDDASTDGSDAVCWEYAAACPEKIRYTRLSENMGPSRSRNTGLKLAKGEYTVFLDSDDCYAPYALGYMSGLIDRYGADIAICQMIMSRTNPFGKAIPVARQVRKMNGTQALKATLYQKTGLHASASAKIYRTELIRKHTFVEGMHYEDLELVSRLYPDAKSVVVSDVPVYFYRRNPSSFINTWTPARLDALKATEAIVRTVAGRCPECLDAARSRRFSALFNIFIESSKHCDTPTADFCWNGIKKGRRLAIKDPDVRAKNKIGAALSYLGRKACLSVLGLFER